MLRLVELVAGQGDAAAGAATPTSPALTLTLTYHERRHSRRRVMLDDGREAALLLPRGTVLADGDRLRGDDAGAPVLVVVRAASETLSVGRTDDPLLLARAAYHLGNRHVPLQIALGRLAWEHDHVLDALAREVGLAVTVEQAPFQPEGGGYGHARAPAAGHEHGHGHAHGHAHGHDHSHGHDGDPDPDRERGGGGRRDDN